MKKLILTALSLVTGATFVHAQGYMTIDATAANVTVVSNSVSLGTAVGASTYDYAVLASATPITDGATDSSWTLVTTFGGAAVVGGGSGLKAGEIVAESGGQFQSNLPVGNYYIDIVGWSSNLGSSWGTVEGELADGWQGVSGYFGQDVSAGNSFATAAASPGDDVMPTGAPNGSLVLDYVSAAAVPEPATLALAGLGGLSMLFLRRRKS